MKLFSLCSISAIALLAAPATAQGILPYLPKKTMVAISAPDLSMSMSEFQQMPVAKMWAEEEVQTFVADVLEMAKEKINEGLEQAREMHKAGHLPVDPDEVMKLRLNGGTLAVTEMGIGMGDFGPLPKFGVVLHLDFGDSAGTWNKLIQMGLGILQQQAGNDVEMTDSKIGEVQMMSLAPRGVEGLEMGLNVAMIPNGIIIGTLASDVRGIVENMNNKTAALTTAPGYQAATKRMTTAGAELEFFMAPDALVDFGMSALKMLQEEERDFAVVDLDGVERALKAMGMRNLGTMAATSTYEDGKCVSRAFHASGKAGTAAAPKTVDKGFLKWVPKDAVSFSAGTLDVASIYDTLLKGLQAYDEDFAQQALAQLAEMEKQLGFSVRNDLFGSLGDHYISWSMPMGTISSMPEVAMLMKVENQEKLVGALKNLVRLTQGMVEIEEGKKRGVTAYELTINFDPSNGMGFNIFDMMRPTFAFKDGYMVVGFSVSDIKRVFKRMDREDDPKGDIRGNKEFAAVAQMIPAGVSRMAFTDWKATFESYYQIGTGVLAFVPMPEDVPIDMSLLPESETLTQHLYGGVSYTKVDAEGSETVDVSPFGPETGVALVLVVVAAGAGAAFMAESGGF